MITKRIETEECFDCFGNGLATGGYSTGASCRTCNGTGTIVHGPWIPCQFCVDNKPCNCPVCQGYCSCKGYFEYYILPYMQEQETYD